MFAKGVRGLNGKEVSDKQIKKPESQANLLDSIE
jgi:hypothetical protein